MLNMLRLCCFAMNSPPTPGGDGQEKPCCMGGGNWSKEPRAQDCLTLQSFGVRVLQQAARKRRVQI